MRWHANGIPCIALLGGLASTPTAGVAQDLPSTAFTVKAPDGFDGGEAPQETLVDIVFAGKRVGSTPARFDAAFITFLDPKGMVSALPSIRDTDIVASALSVPLPTNTRLSCADGDRRARCGFVEAAPVAVIFSPGAISAEVFVSDAHTYGRDMRARYLPPPTVAPALIAGFNGRSFFDLESGSQSAAGSLRLVAGHGRLSAHAELFGSSGASASLRSAYLQHVGKTRELTLGRLPMVASNGLARSPETFGLRYGSTLKTRTDSARLGASELSVATNSGATVQILRDGRVLDIQQVEPGQTLLDSSRLPGGAYMVTLRIEERGAVHEETQFYTSGSRLAPADATQWNVEAGLVSPQTAENGLLPPIGRDLAVKAELSKRVSRNLGLRADLNIGGHGNYASMSFTSLGPSHVAEAGLVASLRGDVGGYANVSLRGPKWNVAAFYRQVHAANPVRFKATAPFDPFTESHEQASIEASLRLPSIHFGLRGNLRSSSFTGQNWRYGPFLATQLAKRGGTRIDLRAQYEIWNDRHAAFIGISLNAPQRIGDFARSGLLSAGATWQYDAPTQGSATTGETVEAMLSANANSLPMLKKFSLGMRSEGSAAGLRADARLETPHATLGIDARKNYQRQTALLADMTSALVVGDAGWEVTNRFSQSGAFLDLDAGPDANFDVLAGGAVRAQVSPGRKRYVGLDEFALHDVAIRPRGASDVDYEGQAERVVLFPGNAPHVKRRVWDVSVIVGRLVDETGDPIAGATIRNGDVWLASTDSDGYFQLDLGREDSVTAELKGISACRLDFGAVRSGATVPTKYRDAGEMICHRSTQPRAPWRPY
jgi:Mat/Ecp fimbriae outer membrane usher protein